MSGPRYCIFPADSLDDERVTATHLRLLAVAGTMSNNNGWFVASQSTMAKRVRCTRETVNRNLRDLVEFGYLRMRGRVGEDGRRLVNEYQVLMDREPARAAREDTTPVTVGSQGVCDASVTYPVTQLDHTPCDAAASQQVNDPFFKRPLSPKGETRAQLSLAMAAHSPASAFESWWMLYPEKVGRGAASKAFDRALRKTSLEALIAGVQRYITSKPADRAWCHPSTWLNQERWTDEPTAAMTTAQKTLGNWALDQLKEMEGAHVVGHQH
ncbi:helix-turn-helix domain-containing protein [Mesorhizobium sp. M00.F.Ca.ET.151.01.1.1]|nr:helix-turn-helix domain-containing protein [Mesorhizobium sp. M00.F.Ca.ET.151.01.1.1]